jgi:hypothetical protein
VPFFAREPDVDAVTGGVVVDAGEVEHLGEDGEALADCLAFAAGVVEGRDELGDIGRGDRRLRNDPLFDPRRVGRADSGFDEPTQRNH